VEAACPQLAKSEAADNSHWSQPTPAENGLGITLICAVPDLSVGVVAPAVGSIVSGQAASVAASHAHLDEPETARDRDRRRTGVDRAIPEYAAAVAPAIGPVVGRYPTAVTAAGTDLPEGEDLRRRCQLSRRIRLGWRWGVLSASQGYSPEYENEHLTGTATHEWLLNE
jgi:hypothetical protein